MAKTQTLQAAYTEAAADISGMVSRLQVHAEALHDVSPDTLNYGHVGDLVRIKLALALALEMFNQNKGANP